MRCASFVYPGSVWWRFLLFSGATVCRILNERQQVATFIANLAVFQQRVSTMPKAPQRLRGKYIEFDETSHCPPIKKYQNVMINFHRRTRRRHRGQRRNDSRTCSIEIFNNEQAVDI